MVALASTLGAISGCGGNPTAEPTAVDPSKATADGGIALSEKVVGAPVGPTSASDVSDSPGAKRLLSELRSRHRAWPSNHNAAADQAQASSSLPPGLALGFQSTAGGLRPRFPTSGVAPTAKVVFPEHSVAAFQLEDVSTGTAVAVAMDDASDVVAEVADGYAVYAHAHLSGATVLHRGLPSGTEDYLLFEKRPRTASIAYRITLLRNVSGLRLVSNTLEMLDAGGAPRLRVEPPYLVSADGARVAATLSVEGCAVDTNSAAPWDRSVTAPGAPVCTARVTWPEKAPIYPAVLDPAWSTTGTMRSPRQDHTATLLSNGKVLVAGGRTSSSATTGLLSAELFDRATGTWAATGNMAGGRWFHSAVQLGTTASTITSGKVLVAGGIDGTSSTNTAQLYSVTAGTWVAAGNLNARRHLQSATVLSNGQVLVAGGMNGTTVLNTAALYNPSSGAGTWTAVATNMVSARRFHTATLLSSSNASFNNKVLIVGGNSGGTTSLSSVQLFDGTGWSNTTSLPATREGHTGTRLTNGNLLITGGKSGANTLDSTSLFKIPSSGTAATWSSAGTMTKRRSAHTATLLPSSVLATGQLLVAGGNDGSTALASAEVWDGNATWTGTSVMPAVVEGHRAVLLPSGAVLIAGGLNGATALNLGRLYDPSIGLSCTSNSQCASGFCVSGICCNTACTNQCMSCALAGSVGICGNKVNGTTCSDGNACTQTDSCQAGACAGSNPKICAASGPCHAPGTCDPVLGSCSNPSLADGTACDDGNPCTGSDSCQTGSCVAGTAKVCLPSDQCHAAGSCNPTDGSCSNPPLANGTACNDKRGCTQTDTCQAGLCAGANATPLTCSGGNPEASFNFTLAQAGKSSAGVFALDGTLVKTLWSGAAYAPGTHVQSWDGTDDLGRLAADGNYQIRVLTSRATYTWEGVIGNSSDNASGPSVLHFLTTITGMAVTGPATDPIAYVATGYEEGSTSQARLRTAAPGSKRSILSKGALFLKVATDGTNVYWAGEDANLAGDGGVMATAVGSDQQVPFQFGQLWPITFGMTYNSGIDIVTSTAGAEPTGLAVQNTHPYLFVSRGAMNSLHVVDKVTGRVIQRLSYTAPGDLAIDANDGLWMIHTVGGVPTVQHFAVNSDGTLAAADVSLSGLTQPLALACNSSTLLVADGAASQQVKKYDLSGVALGTPLGVAGGYATDPTVTDFKFDFQATGGGMANPFLAFQSDGSLWVGDPGDCRVQHYSSSGAFINRISYIPIFYSTAVDPNAPTRVFGNYLEFQVDYNLPLGPTNGSWKLVRNWRPGVPQAFDNPYGRVKYVTTLSNGRTYASMAGTMFELPPTGTARNTNVVLPGDALYADGSVRSVSQVGGTKTWTQRSLAGFDGSFNPSWGPETVLATAPLTPLDPLDSFDMNKRRAGTMTTGGIIVSYDTDPTGLGWHLGGVRVGGTSWLWKGSHATPPNYLGDWPTDGAFDVGNAVMNAGGAVMTVDRHIIYGYRGEHWKGVQTNKFRHYYEDGLLVDEFGVLGSDLGSLEAAPQMAGNVYSWLVKLPDGRTYLYHSDESYHGGVHRWRIDGLDTVTEQTTAVDWHRDSQPGLQGQYVDTPDWNNLNQTSARLDSQVNFNWGSGTPTGTGLTHGDAFSVIWSGYVIPRFDESYTIAATADDFARVWVDGQLVQTGDGTPAVPIALKSGVSYPIRIEYLENTATASVALTWASASQAAQVIPASSLAYLPPGTDLMAGLPSNGPITNGTSGWNLTPRADSGDYWNTWTVDALQNNGNPYLNVFFRTSTAVDTLTRDLGSPSDTTTRWELNMMVRYDSANNSPNHQSCSGQYMDVLDDAGKVVARFYPNQVSWPDDARIIANNQVVVQTDISTLVNTILPIWRPLRVAAENGQVSFQYGDFPAVVAPRFDATANWRRIKTLLFYYWTSDANCAYARSISVDGLRLKTTDASEGKDLLAGLPLHSPLVSGQYGWTVSAPVAGQWSVVTNRTTWDSAAPFEVSSTFYSTTGTKTLARDLGTPSNLTTRWDLAAQIKYEDNEPNHGPMDGQYLDVLDDTGKVIARFYPLQVAYPGDERIMANGAMLAQTDLTALHALMRQWRPLHITATAGQVTFQYASYPPVTAAALDPGADWRRAKTLQISASSTGSPYPRYCSLDDLTYAAIQ